MGLPKFSVNRPITTLMIYSAVIIVGIIALTRLPIELLPNFSFAETTSATAPKISTGFFPEISNDS